MVDWKYNDDKKKEYAGRLIGYIIAYLLKSSKLVSDNVSEKIGSEFGEFISGIEFPEKDTRSLNALWDKALDQTWVSMKKMRVPATNMGSETLKFDYPQEFWQPLEHNLFRTAESLGTFLNIGSPCDQVSRGEYVSALDELIISYHSGSKEIDADTISEDFSFVFLDILEHQIEKEASLRNHFDIIKNKMRIIAVEGKAQQVGDMIEHLLPISKSRNVPLTLTEIPIPVSLIGRDRDISAIRSCLDNQSIVSIHAGGGIGKTAVTLRIINDIKREITEDKADFYKTCAWITSTGDVKEDLLKLDIPEISAYKTEKEKMRALRSFLQGNKTFVVLDNMDIPPTDEEIDFLNTCAGRTKILITTRATISEFGSYELEALDPDSALILFYRHFHKRKAGGDLTLDQARTMTDSKFAAKIIDMACYNSLFIELIANMARTDHWDLEMLGNRLEKDVFGQDSRFSVQTAHSKSHHTKGSMLYQIRKLYEMSGLTDRQKEIVEFISEFPAEHNIFFDVFRWAGFEDDGEDNLGALEDRGWIERSEDGYLMHTMVQGSVAQQLILKDAPFNIWKYDTLIQKMVSTDEYVPITLGWRKIRERIAVPEAICKKAFAYEKDDTSIASICNSLARVYNDIGDYSKALDYFGKALIIRENVLGKSHHFTAATYNDLAMVYRNIGDYDKALECFGKALTISEKLLGKDHLDTATTYNNLAVVYQDIGDYDKAMGHYGKALIIREKVLGKDHPDTAATYNNFAGVYYDRGDYDKALEYYGKALIIREKELGKDHPDTATTYNNLAGVYEAIGDYNNALEYYGKALTIRENVLGKNHPFTAATYNDFAGVYQDIGDYDKALEYYEKALAIKEKVLGKGHPNTAATYDNLAGLLYYEGDYDKALEYYGKALTIREKMLGKDHPDTAATYNNLAGVFYCEKDYGKALEYYGKALAISEKVLGTDHPFTAATYNNLALVYKNIGDYDKAMEYFEKDLAISEKVLEKDHPYITETYYNLAILYERIGNSKKAQEYRQKITARKD